MAWTFFFCLFWFQFSVSWYLIFDIQEEQLYVDILYFLCFWEIKVFVKVFSYHEFQNVIMSITTSWSQNKKIKNKNSSNTSGIWQLGTYTPPSSKATIRFWKTNIKSIRRDPFGLKNKRAEGEINFFLKNSWNLKILSRL